MKRKILQRKQRVAIVGTVLAVLILGIAAVVYSFSLSKTQVKNASDIPTQQISGEVTRVNTGGRDLYRDEEGVIKQGPHSGYADTNDSISVEGITITTSSGNGSVDDRFYVDIGMFAPGDNVRVVYGIKENGEKTLNCKECSVQRLQTD